MVPFEVFLAPLLPKSGLALSAQKENHSSSPHKAVHDPLLAHGGQFLVPAAVKVIAVPPPVGEVREPGLGDEPCLPTKELPVGHLSAAGDEAVPLPGILLRIAGPPEEVGGVLLRGEAIHLVF